MKMEAMQHSCVFSLCFLSSCQLIALHLQLSRRDDNIQKKAKLFYNEK